MVTAAQQNVHDTCIVNGHIFANASLAEMRDDTRQKALMEHLRIYQRHLSEHLACCGWPQPTKQPVKVGGKFFITFTKRPDVRFEFFKLKVVDQLKREVFMRGKYAFEHVSTNAHCHAYVESPYNLCRGTFKSMEKHCGFVDVRRVGVDNGVDEYISKEGEYVFFENIKS